MRQKNETPQLHDFISRTEAVFGPRVWIRRWMDSVRSGIPDSCAIIDSIFLPIEAKHSKGGKECILEHPFTFLQIETMLEIKGCGGYPVGLIFKDGQERYILPEDIPEGGQISLDLFMSLPIFRWEDVIKAGREHVLRFRRQ